MKYVTLKNGTTPYICGTIAENLNNIFETPIRSCYFNIFKGVYEDKEVFSLYPITCIKCKLVAVGYDNEIFFFPLLHTL